MRRRHHARTWRLTLGAAALAACGSASALAQDGPTTGRVAEVSPPGALKVRQRKGEAFADATTGMVVRRGYRLELVAGRASVRCADGKLHQLKPGPQGCPCVDPEKGMMHDGSNIPGTRGTDTAGSFFPVVLSPRGKLLLTTRPTLRWSPVAAPTPGAAVTYRVGIYNEAMELVWRRQVAARTELEYPADEKPLTRGEVYKVIAEAGRRTSEEERTADLNFTVVPDAEAKEIGDAEAAIRGLNLSPAATQFFIADLYAARDLASEAIEKLEALKGGLKELAVLRMLGDLYAGAGLHREAVTHYEGALALPQAAGDLEGQALTLVALGRSYAALQKPAEAGARFAKAVEAFARLNVTVTAEQLSKKTPE